MQVIRACLLNVMAHWSILRGDSRSAIQRFESLRQIIEKRHGYGHIKTAPVLFNLASAYHHSGVADNFRFAILLYQRILNIAETTGETANDEIVGKTAEAMGDWLAQVANYDMAESSYQTAIEAFERLHGPSSLRLLKPLGSRSKALRLLGRSSEAQQLEQQAAWIEEAHARMTVTEDYHRHYPRF